MNKEKNTIDKIFDYDSLMVFHNDKYSEFSKFINPDNIKIESISESVRKENSNPYVILSQDDKSITCKFRTAGVYFPNNEFWVWCWDQIISDKDINIDRDKLSKFNEKIKSKNLDFFNQVCHKYSSGKSMMIRKDSFDLFVKLLLFIYDPMWIVVDTENTATNNLYLIDSIIKNN